MSEQRLTNLEYIEELGMGDDDLLIEMIGMFLENTPESLKNIRKNNEKKNWKKVAAEAHKLKPNLSYMGLETAKDIIVEIEQNAKDNPDQHQIEDKLEQVEQICEKAYRELQEELQELKE